MNAKAIIMIGLAVVSGFVSASVQIDPGLQVGPVVSHFGWDLKGWAGHFDTPAKAEDLYGGEVQANVLRVPLWALAHLQNGTIDTNVYDYAEMLNGMTNVLAVNPDVKIFASLKLKFPNTFPEWIESGEWGWIFGYPVKKPDPVKYAQLIADYIEFMKDHGFAIDYLGIGNETEFALTSDRYIATLDALYTELVTRGLSSEYTSFQLIAPETYGVDDAVDYMSDIASNSGLDKVDIIGAHFYPHSSRITGSSSDWTTLKNTYGNPLWHTEVHLEGDDSQQQNLRNALSLLFDINKRGVTGFSWWAKGTWDADLDHVIRKRCARTMMGAYPIYTSPGYTAKGDPAGEPLYQAYRRGNAIELWICNPGATQTNVFVDVGIDNIGGVSSEYWTGTDSVITTTNSGTLSITVDDISQGLTIAEVPAGSTSLIKFGFMSDPVTLIDPTTLNGGFESGTTSTSISFNAVDIWSNFRPEDGDELRCRRSTVLDGASNRAHSGEWGAEIRRNNDWSYQAPMQNTGHIIQAGDVFSLEAYIMGAWNWDSGADRVRMNLFTYDDDGTTLIGVGNLDAHTDINWNAWTHVTNTFAAVASDSAAIGRELHIRFQSLSDRNETALLDDVTLTVASELMQSHYEQWTIDSGLFVGVNNNPTNDPDEDIANNLYEYAMGGDPVDPANKGISPTYFTLGDAGTNWLVYVHPVRSDPASGLEYRIELNDDLVYGVWTNSGYEVLGTNVPGGELNYVTNGLPTDDDNAGFVRLNILKVN